MSLSGSMPRLTGPDQTRFARRGDVLQATLGAMSYTTSGTHAAFDAIAAELRRAPAGAVLVDARSVTGHVSLLQRMLLVRHVAGLKLGVRLALVVPPALVHRSRFAMFAARRRGINIMAFTEYTDAVDWLSLSGHVTL